MESKFVGNVSYGVFVDVILDVVIFGCFGGEVRKVFYVDFVWVCKVGIFID